MKQAMATKKISLSGVPVTEEKKVQHLSPFELKNRLITKAQETAETGKYKFLNAGRGNPDFFNSTVRGAFCKLTYFALHISSRSENQDLRFRPATSDDLAEQFDRFFVDDESPEAVFLKEAINCATDLCGLARNQLIYDLAAASLGDFYPDPPQMLTSVEVIVNKYLEQVLLANNSDVQFQLFATEGGTAGMVYAFKSLEENFLLNKRDKVAIITPVFSPYLEIPQLNDFDFNVVPIRAEERLGGETGEPWYVPQEEIEKLKDQAIKVLYLINPTNPTAVALSDETIAGIVEVVAVNKNLIILVDAVYATFVESFHSIINRLPKNCIVVYSFSKYFGVTGWRLGVIMVGKDNVMDRLISDFPAAWKEELAQRYLIDWEHPEKAKFIDRLVMDSRDVALAHTAGLSCPQQAIMALFALFNLLQQDEYKSFVRNLLKERIKNLYGNFKQAITYSDTEHDTHYYALLDVLELARKVYDDTKFAEYMVENFYPVDFVYCLAIDTASVCLPGYGFFATDPSATKEHQGITRTDRKNWSVRVSLANLGTDDYLALGKNLMAVLDKYYKYYSKHKA